MIALMLKPKTARALLQALPDDVRDEYGETAADLHITLVYLGEVDDYITEFRDEIAAVIERVAGEFPPIKGEVSGYGVFNGTMPVVYASYDSPDLTAFRQALWDGLKDYPIKPPNDHGFDPHITLAYADVKGKDIFIPTMPASFEAVSLVWAGERQDFPLIGTVAKLARPTQKAASNLYADELRAARAKLTEIERGGGRGLRRNSPEYDEARLDYLDIFGKYLTQLSNRELYGDVTEYARIIDGEDGSKVVVVPVYPYEITIADPNNITAEERRELDDAMFSIRQDELE